MSKCCSKTLSKPKTAKYCACVSSICHNWVTAWSISIEQRRQSSISSQPSQASHPRVELLVSPGSQPATESAQPPKQQTTNYPCLCPSSAYCMCAGHLIANCTRARIPRSISQSRGKQRSDNRPRPSGLPVLRVLAADFRTSDDGRCIVAWHAG
jgi:hypothetical protein